jgi:diguanylate cyclase (GGDEF)-like protein
MQMIGIVVSILVFRRIGFRVLGPGEAGTIFIDGLNLLANLLAIGGCLIASRRGRSVARFFWLLFGSALTLQLIANAGWAYSHLFHIAVHETALFPSLFYRLYAGPMAIALFLSEDVYRSRFETFLDGSIVVGLVALTTYQLQMAELSAHDAKMWRLISVSVAVNFILLLAAVARLVFSSRASLRGLFARQTVFLGTYLGVSIVTSIGDAYFPEIDASIDLIWIAPYLVAAALAFTWYPPPPEVETPKPKINRRGSLLCFNLTLATMVLSSAVLGFRVVDSIRIAGLLATGVVLFSYAIRCSLMQDKQEKYLAALQESRAQLQHQALYDDLTGLPNRRLFAERLSHTLAVAQREGHSVALLYVDLDGFKPVNDRHGHGVGDLLLKDTAVRMLARVRKSDTLARMGGDEFTVLLAGLINTDDATLVAKELLRALSEPFEIDGHVIELTASIGIGVFPESAANAEALMHQADKAMYAVKHGSKNEVRYYAAELETLDFETRVI